MLNSARKKRWSATDTEFTALALPTVLWYVLFCYLPMFGVIIAFKNYRISGGFIKSVFTSSWAGLTNFKFLFANKDVWIIIRNTLLYNGVIIICGMVFPVTLALISAGLDIPGSTA
jgi:putative aldouronate transport system permease protein